MSIERQRNPERLNLDRRNYYVCSQLDGEEKMTIELLEQQNWIAPIDISWFLQQRSAVPRRSSLIRDMAWKKKKSFNLNYIL